MDRRHGRDEDIFGSEMGRSMIVRDHLGLAEFWHQHAFLHDGASEHPLEMYEAAAIDGASSTQRFSTSPSPCWAVTQMVMNALLGSLRGPDLVLAMTNGAPNGKK